jgi:hypothetical protein
LGDAELVALGVAGMAAFLFVSSMP